MRFGVACVERCYRCKGYLNACNVVLKVQDVYSLFVDIRTMLLSVKFVVNLFFFVNEKYLYDTSGSDSDQRCLAVICKRKTETMVWAVAGE